VCVQIFAQRNVYVMFKCAKQLFYSHCRKAAHKRLVEELVLHSKLLIQLIGCAPLRLTER